MSFFKWQSTILVILSGINQSMGGDGVASICLILVAIWIILFEWRINRDDK